MVPLLVKVIVSVPPVEVKVAKVWPPDCRLPPLTVNNAPEVLKSKVSAETAVPERCTVRLAPDQLPLPPLSAPFSASLRTALLPESSVTVLPAPAQATLSPLRLPMPGAELIAMSLLAPSEPADPGAARVRVASLPATSRILPPLSARALVLM